ncbi:MAG: hypothetical protein JWO98_670, partial [Frankiales bacterium]|nr:hypothetical protein [Frankiales bacterium]
ERCRRRVPGGGVCRFHGGAAVQVERRREARLVVAAARTMYSEDFAEREPGEVLLAAVRDVDAIVQQIKRQVERREELTGTDLLALGDWLDRAAKLSKAALDAGVQERQVRLAEQQGQLLAAAGVAFIARVVSGLALDAAAEPLIRREFAVMLRELSASQPAVLEGRSR